MMMRWFRRNQKIMMVALVCMLMLAFVVLPSIGRLARTSQAAVGKIRGRSVAEHEMSTVSEQMAACRQIWLELALYPGIYADAQPMVTFVFPDRSVLLSRGFRPTSDQIWRYMVLLREAESAGVQVTAKELAGIPASQSELRQAAVGLLRIVKVCRLRGAAAYVSDPELWAEYAYGHERAKVRFVELRPRTFGPLVETAPEDVRAFYDERKGVEPDPLTGVVGYQAPKRVRMEYALADLDDFKQRVSVSETEIKDYYEGHKSEFVAKQGRGEEEKGGAVEAKSAGEEAGAKPGEAEQPAEAAEPGDKPQGKVEGDAPPGAAEAEAPKAEQPAEAAEPGDKPQGKVEGDAAPGAAEAEAPKAEGPAEQKEPTYKPLEKVEGEIRAKLLESKASEAARGAMNSMLSDLDEVAGQFMNEPPPLEQMARRFRLRHESFRTDGGQRALSRKEVESGVPGGEEVAHKVFDEEPMPNFVNLVEDTPKGPLAFMVVEQIAAASEPFDLVQDRVRQDLLTDKALRYAQTVAGNLTEQAAKSSFEEAVQETNGRLASLLGEGAGQAEGDSILKIDETDFFSRAEPTIPKMGGMRQKVVEEAFRLDVDQFATVVDGGADEACYVIRKLEQEPADAAGFYQDERAQRAVAVYFKKARLAQEWLQELLEKSPLPEQRTRQREVPEEVED